MSHATQLHDRGYLADSMQIMHRVPPPGHCQGEVYHQVHACALETVQWTLEQALDEEVRAYLGRARAMSETTCRTAQKRRAVVPMGESYGRSMGGLPISVCPNCAGAIAICRGRRSRATNTVGGHC